MYYREQFNLLTARLKEKRRFIQVLSGPRQTGKTTLARQAVKATTLPFHYASADDPKARLLQVGSGGIDLETFLSLDTSAKWSNL